ncbi:hypothetical protein BC831DRAFT_459340 [Entophlyctis helioformis]|nr:hypothetical protein BC831DRAFT_459340 [Entophlyctis helioformis]
MRTREPSRESDVLSMNPHVITPDDEVDDLLESFLSPEKLMALTGTADLNSIRFLELKVDSRKTGLGNLGRSIPNVHQLKLNNSFVPRIRDIGSGFNNLRILWMARCELDDIDGIGSLHQLRELYLAYNQISEISSVSMLEHLEILDLEGNEVADLDQIEHLALCPNLQQLTLEGNPLDFEERLEQQELASAATDTQLMQGLARRIITGILRQIKILDDEPVDSTGLQSRGLAGTQERPSTSYGRSKSPAARSQTTALPARPVTSYGRPAEYIGRSKPDASSDLTYGTDTVLAGNPIMLLRARRKDRSRPLSAAISSLVPETPSTDTHGLARSMEQSPDVLVLDTGTAVKHDSLHKPSTLPSVADPAVQNDGTFGTPIRSAFESALPLLMAPASLLSSSSSTRSTPESGADEASTAPTDSGSVAAAITPRPPTVPPPLTTGTRPIHKLSPVPPPPPPSSSSSVGTSPHFAGAARSRRRPILVPSSATYADNPQPSSSSHQPDEALSAVPSVAHVGQDALHGAAPSAELPLSSRRSSTTATPPLPSHAHQHPQQPDRHQPATMILLRAHRKHAAQPETTDAPEPVRFQPEAIQQEMGL